MIVVDLGYWGHGMYDSVGSLIEHYQPEIVYGFDPLGEDVLMRRGETVVVTRRLAAWLHNGTVAWTNSGTGSRAGTGPAAAPCFDFTAWLKTLPEGVIVKMDVEGGEHPLCRELRRTQTDLRLERLIIELHGDLPLPPLACPVEEWWM